MQEEWCWAGVLPGSAQVHLLVQYLTVRGVWTMLLACCCCCGKLVAVAPAWCCQALHGVCASQFRRRFQTLQETVAEGSGAAVVEMGRSGLQA